MTDDKITTLDQKQSKNPKDSAINQIKESAVKEFNDKIKQQVKLAVDAAKIARSEKHKLENMLTDFEEEKATLADLLKSI